MDKDESDIDAVVRHLQTQVTKLIDCTKCANCCKEMGPRLSKPEIKAIAGYLGITQKKVIAHYLKERKDKAGEYMVARIPCPFLKKDRCVIYDVRPQSCRSYPNIRTEFIKRIVGFVGNYPVCPIVVNVYDQLKTKFKFNEFVQ